MNREGNSVVLRINKAKIPNHLARPYITSEFATAIQEILPRQDKEDVVFDIAMKQMTPYFVSQDNKLLIMDFDIPDEVKNKVQPVKTVALDTVTSAVQTSGYSEPSKQPYVKGLSPETALEQHHQHGYLPQIQRREDHPGFPERRHSQYLKDHRRRERANIATSDEVKGTITIRLKDIPWTRAWMWYWKVRTLIRWPWAMWCVLHPRIKSSKPRSANSPQKRPWSSWSPWSPWLSPLISLRHQRSLLL